MDEQKNLILIKGENKTRQVERCFYDPQTQRFNVTYVGGKTYPYGYTSVKWLKNPKARNPALYKISKDGTSYFGVQAIFVFREDEEWWHLVFDNACKTCRKSELQIEKSCMDEAQVRDKLSYLRDVAGINELKNDDGEVLLQKQYEKLTFVGENSALAAYLHPRSHPVKVFESGNLIFHLVVMQASLRL